MDKLLPKNKLFKNKGDRKLEILHELISGEESTFVSLGERNLITNVRRWEQAFRVYAAVYSEANPARAAEIWQYMYVINTAAGSYQWDNVYEYDYTFRQLMAKKPHCSWAKTYNQAWNLCMRDPLPKNSANSQAHMHVHSNSGNSWRDSCCWKYNRNKCKSGSGCAFDHRCTYCGAWNSHGYFNCNKRLKKQHGANERHDKISPAKHVTTAKK